MPVVFVHVTESGVDTTLGGNSVGSGWEQLGDTSDLEALLNQTEGGSKTGTTGTDDNTVVFVVNDVVVLGHGGGGLLTVQVVELVDDLSAGRRAREKSLGRNGFYTSLE